LRKKELERSAAAMKNLWERIYKPVKHMVDVLGKDNPKIYNTLLTNISDIVDILPDLNMTDDPKLNELGTEIQEKLCDSSIEELRKSDFRKKELHESAESLRQKIKKEGNIDDDAVTMMNSYTGSTPDQDKVMNEFGKPITGQRRLKINDKNK